MIIPPKYTVLEYILKVLIIPDNSQNTQQRTKETVDIKICRKVEIIWMYHSIRKDYPVHLLHSKSRTLKCLTDLHIIANVLHDESLVICCQENDKIQYQSNFL